MTKHQKGKTCCLSFSHIHSVFITSAEGPGNSFRTYPITGLSKLSEYFRIPGMPSLGVSKGRRMKFLLSRVDIDEDYSEGVYTEENPQEYRKEEYDGISRLDT